MASAPIGSGESQANLLSRATRLMCACLFGLASLAISCFAIYDRCWAQGIARRLPRVVIPIVSIFSHGKL